MRTVRLDLALVWDAVTGGAGDVDSDVSRDMPVASLVELGVRVIATAAALTLCGAEGGATTGLGDPNSAAIAIAAVPGVAGGARTVRP